MSSGTAAERLLEDAATHGTRHVHDRLIKRPRRHLRSTRTSAPWLDLVEGWPALVTERPRPAR